MLYNHLRISHCVPLLISAIMMAWLAHSDANAGCMCHLQCTADDAAHANCILNDLQQICNELKSLRHPCSRVTNMS